MPVKSPARDHIAIALLTVVVSLAIASTDARAVTQPRAFMQNATGACQPALPAFEGQIRKRPLAVQNEGTASAFVSCSLMAERDSIGGIKGVYLYADNRTGAPISLSCTLVTGVSGGTSFFYPKTITMPANSALNQFMWTPADNGGVNFNNFAANLSCSLPVGTGVSITFIDYDIDVGG